MIYDEVTGRQIADFLLEIKAVILRPDQPFTWASGWKSPIYCDNRMILSEPKVRNYIRDQWVSAIKSEFPDVNALAGVATAGIAHAAMLADHLSMPMAYIRSKPKDHGTGKLIEGRIEKDKQVLVIEDLVSTGGSSMSAIEGLISEGINVNGLMSIFSYGFHQAEELFESNKIVFVSLCNYDILLEQAIKSGYIQNDTLPLLQKWKESPSTWHP